VLPLHIRLDATSAPAPQIISSPAPGLASPGSGGGLLAVYQVAETADVVQHRALALPATTGLRRRLVDPIGESAQRERLQPDPSRTGQVREEESFTPEERRLDATDELHVVGDARLQRDEAAGIDPQALPRLQIHEVDGASGVQERQPITLEPLHDEPLASEESDPDFFWNAMPMDTPFAAQRNASF